MKIQGARYVKPCGRSSGPVRLLTAECQTVISRGKSAGETHYRQASHVYYTFGRRARDKWYGDTEPKRLTVSEWWDMLDALTPEGGRLYVICPVASDFLTMTGYWSLVECGRYRLREVEPIEPAASPRGRKKRKAWQGKLVLRGRPDIIHCRGNRGSIIFVSAGNWNNGPLSDLCRSAGVSYDPDRDIEPASEGGRLRADLAARTLAIFFRRMILRWISDGNGPWRDTAGQLAQSIWRARFYAVKVCRHKEPEAQRLESEACHGGRASVWYWGDVGSYPDGEHGGQIPPPRSTWHMDDTEAHRLDIKSMYPSILARELFPTKLSRLYASLPISKLSALCQHYGIIARVRIDPDAGEYPLREDERTTYPTGKFWTTLAGPELVRACRDGIVLECGTTAQYEVGRPLQGVAKYLIAERQRCKAEGDVAGETIAKLLANSLGGKFAQRADRWELAKGVQASRMWGEWIVSLPDKVTYKRYRATAGIAYEHVKGQPGGQLLAAIFAYLTAYGRIRMRSIREQIGSASVLSQDTDGLWVTDSGLDSCGERGLCVPNTPGMMEYKETSAYCRWLSPKHYYHSGSWILSGIVKGFTALDGMRFREVLTQNPVRYRPDEAPSEVRFRHRDVDLSFIRPDTPVDPITGWGQPWVVGPDRPRPWRDILQLLDDAED